jgi:glycosyltransferase involved in cell wall biosynthesis
VPINKEIEAFGQTYVEALAAEIPSVFTLSGIASEFVQNNNNALLVEYEDFKQIYDSIIQILVNKKLRETLIQNGRKSIEQFKLEIFINKLEQLYV